jgi:hypothetical protein
MNGYSQTTTTTTSTDNGLTFCCGVGAAANLAAVNPMMNPFPVLASGQRVVLPNGNTLGANVLAGQGRHVLSAQLRAGEAAALEAQHPARAGARHRDRRLL